MDVEHDGIRTPVIQSSRKLEPSKVHAGWRRHFPEYKFELKALDLQLGPLSLNFAS